MQETGYLRKMGHCINKDNSVSYYLRLKEQAVTEASKVERSSEVASQGRTDIHLNEYLGKKLKLEFQNEIACVACGRKTNTSFSQGYCYPCMQTLAECDLCILKPELCHYDNGTCRDNDFADSHCNIPHLLYLSLTSSAKIGITRNNNELVRWVDQGAVQAIRLARVGRRKHAGLIETQIAKTIQDKTNWRKMLKNEYDDIDLKELRRELLASIQEWVEEYNEENDSLTSDADLIELEVCKDTAIQEIQYPVLAYPSKIKSHNFDKNPLVEGTLEGIKGQYLIFDTGVINLRKFAGYKIQC